MTDPLGEALGLGAQWRPAPVQYHLAKVGVVTDTGPGTLFVLIVEAESGRAGYAFSPDEFRDLGNKILGHATGLIIAGGNEVNGNQGAT